MNLVAFFSGYMSKTADIEISSSAGKRFTMPTVPPPPPLTPAELGKQRQANTAAAVNRKHGRNLPTNPLGLMQWPKTVPEYTSAVKPLFKPAVDAAVSTVQNVKEKGLEGLKEPPK